MNDELKSSGDWLKEFPNLEILDLDGWNRNSGKEFWDSWNELITKKEFENRVAYSTISHLPSLTNKPKLEFKEKYIPWKVTIDDGFCAYEYVLTSNVEDVSIYDLYELIRERLRAEKTEGKFIK